MNLFKHHNLMLIGAHHLMLLLGIYIYGFNPIVAVAIFLYTILYNYLIAHHVVHFRFSHRSYEDTWFNKFLTFFVLLGGFGSPLSFAGLHRIHHKYVDTPKDPHSPKYIGWWRVWLLLWNVQFFTPSVVRDYLRSPFQVFVHNHWIKLHCVILAVAFYIDPRLVFFVISPSVIGTIHYAGLINVRGHIYGEVRNAPEIMFTQPFSWRHKEHHDNG